MKRQKDARSESSPRHPPSGRAPSQARLALHEPYPARSPVFNCSVPTGTPTIPIPCRTTVSPVSSIAARCSSVRCSGPTPSASRACDLLEFSEMPSTSRRFCSYSVTFAIAAMSRESSGDRVNLTPSMNETALVPGTGGIVPNYSSILSEPRLLHSGLRLQPCGTLRADSTTCNRPPYNRGFPCVQV